MLCQEYPYGPHGDCKFFYSTATFCSLYSEKSMYCDGLAGPPDPGQSGCTQDIGKSCDFDSDCQMQAGITCCGAGNNWGICCPDGVCLICTTSMGTTFQYCGRGFECPDYPVTTPRPAYKQKSLR